MKTLTVYLILTLSIVLCSLQIFNIVFVKETAICIETVPFIKQEYPMGYVKYEIAFDLEQSVCKTSPRISFEELK